MLPADQAEQLGLDPKWHYTLLHVEVGAGEILVLPAGWYHQTRSVEAPSLGLSQFSAVPVPTEYYTVVAPAMLQCTQFARCPVVWDRASGRVHPSAPEESQLRSCNMGPV